MSIVKNNTEVKFFLARFPCSFFPLGICVIIYICIVVVGGGGGGFASLTGA